MHLHETLARDLRVVADTLLDISRRGELPAAHRLRVQLLEERVRAQADELHSPVAHRPGLA